MTARALILNRSTNSARYTATEIADLSLNNSKSQIYTSSSLESVNSSTNLWIGLPGTLAPSLFCQSSREWDRT